jgi:hypothetical protein
VKERKEEESNWSGMDGKCAGDDDDDGGKGKERSNLVKSFGVQLPRILRRGVKLKTSANGLSSLPFPSHN